MNRVSKYFTLEDWTYSEYAVRNDISNYPSVDERETIKVVSMEVMDRIVELFEPNQVFITSGYRSKIVNAGVGGSQRSQHVKGQAADFVIHGLHPDEVVERIRESPIVFDQLISEFGRWVHISHVPGGPNRKHVMRAYKHNGRTEYIYL